jgi:hypothetical protein
MLEVKIENAFYVVPMALGGLLCTLCGSARQLCVNSVDVFTLDEASAHRAHQRKFIHEIHFKSSGWGSGEKYEEICFTTLFILKSQFQRLTSRVKREKFFSLSIS